ncbi:MAG: site-specific integrase [Candidatus Aenigmatarchaeota archaeon]
MRAENGTEVPSTPPYSDLKSLKSSVVSSESSDWDIYNTIRRYTNHLNKIPHWDTAENNKELILNFLKKTEIEGIGLVQRVKYVDAFRTLLTAVNKDMTKFTGKDLEEFLYHMRIYKPKTRHTRWYSIKKFFRYIDKKDIYNNIEPHFDKKGMKLPEELLTEDDIKKMISAANNIRDKALISVLYESGARIGELLTRRRKHITFDDYGAVMTVDGKIGMRRVRLIHSVPLLANWMENHPKRDDDNVFLWISMNDYTNPVKYMAIANMLKLTAKHAGIKKRIYPHIFRHSRATYMANKLTEQQLKVYFGWTGDSAMASTYVHLSGRDVDNAILELNGIKEKTEENGNGFKVKNCPRCRVNSDPSSKYCNRCGMVLDDNEAFDLKDLTSNEDFKVFLQEAFVKWKGSRVV